MTIGIFRTGRMALRLAALSANQGHAVTLGSRAPARARALAHAMRRPGITGGSYAFITAALRAGAAVTHGALALELFDQAGVNQR